MMSVDENIFFREATLRICSSLDIETALQRFFEYIRSFIPVIRMDLHILDADRNVLQFVAVVGLKPLEGSGQVRLPESNRDERAAILKNVAIRIMNRPDPKMVSPEFHKSLGLKYNNVSVMNMALKPEGNWIGNLVLVADGLNQYTDEHARLLLLLHGPVAIAMSNAMKHQEVLRFKDMMVDDNRYLYRELRSVSGDKIIGSDSGLKAVMEMVNQVAPLQSPVLLLGETGTGKEVVANAIHYSSPRKDAPFIKVNCGAIPETLLDSELFGHEKGAFTGAISQRRGRFERADRGTIFLDEIGELPPQAQVRLLHVLQKKEIERVGGTNPIPVDVHTISATHRNLEEMIASGRFREDLWFRLNVFPITIPPLRQRREDIPALVYYFIDRKSRELNLRERPVLASGAMSRLIAYDWPGNVRELENIVERALIQHRGGLLSFETLLPLTVFRGRETLEDTVRNRALHSLDEMNSRHIRRALEMAGGKINGPGGAGQILGLHPNTLRKRMNKLGIPYGRKSWQPSIGQTGETWKSA
jgi:hydrogenase-4 transcriptional activator